MTEQKILGVKINFGLTKNKFLDEINNYISSGVSGYVCTVNPEFIMDAQTDEEFLNILNESLMNIPDGTGVLMAGEYLSAVEKLKNTSVFKNILLGLRVGFLGKYNDAKMTGADSIYDICGLCSEKGYSIFLLGGWEKDFFGKPLPTHGNVSGIAAEKLQKQFPELKIVGYSSDFKRDPVDDDRTIEFIQNKIKGTGVSHIDVMFVAYNHKYQEKWLKRNMKKIPATLGFGIGGTLDFIAGTKKRAPKAISKIHLEWLYRLLMEPWRFKRIFKAFPSFPIRVFLRSLRSK